MKMLTPEQEERVEILKAHIKNGLNVEQIAKEMRLSKQTIYNLIYYHNIKRSNSRVELSSDGQLFKMWITRPWK